MTFSKREIVFFVVVEDLNNKWLKANHSVPFVNLRKFFKSANFEGWLRHRQREIRQKLELLHLEALGKAVSRAFNQK